MTKGYRQLEVWKQGKQIAVQIYRITNGPPWDRDWGLRDQVRRAAVSIPSNIAEGDARGSNRDSIRFFRIALGSLAELETQLEIAQEIGYLPPDQLRQLAVDLQRLGGRLGALIRSRSDT